MIRYIPFLLGLIFCSACSNKTIVPQVDIKIPFEKNDNQTATYHEAIDFYKKMANQYPEIQITEYGLSDVGEPIHAVVLSKSKIFDPNQLKQEGKVILMVNNAIHAGEPCGVDATMLLTRDLMKKEVNQQLLDKAVVVIIPFYNIGGGLNRGAFSRTNQNGPLEHGFRGNAKNLDLNRDFIKVDSKNAIAFTRIFQKWKPDIFLDNHTSNGADYQYTMTMIATQHNKLGKTLGNFQQTEMLPTLYKSMEAKNWEMTPYVYARKTPDDGIAAFLDLPRYSSGYAALFNTLSFIPETHMLKPFKDRVKSTYAFMETVLEYIDKNAEKIKTIRHKAIKETRTKQTFDINWTMDIEKVDSFLFKGYEAKYKPSLISGQDRLYYDHNAPYSKYISFYNHYKATATIDKPKAYIVSQAYSTVIDRLKWNGVEMQQLKENKTFEVEMYRIEDHQTGKSPYEGHYLHKKIKVKKLRMDKTFRKGDYLIYTNQSGNRYIIETLEPHAPDSFFAWNFFDSILQQKEYFSPYVFEDLAIQYLEDDPKLKQDLEKKKKENEAFAKNAYAQLEYIYKRSPHYENTHKLYPVARLVE